MIDPISTCAFITGAVIGGGSAALIRSRVSRIYEYAKCTFFPEEHIRFNQDSTIYQGGSCFNRIDLMTKAGLSLTLTCTMTPLLLSLPSTPFALGLVVTMIALPILKGIIEQIEPLVFGVPPRYLLYVEAPKTTDTEPKKITEHTTESYIGIYHKFPFPWNEGPILYGEDG